MWGSAILIPTEVSPVLQGESSIARNYKQRVNCSYTENLFTSTKSIYYLDPIA